MTFNRSSVRLAAGMLMVLLNLAPSGIARAQTTGTGPGSNLPFNLPRESEQAQLSTSDLNTPFVSEGIISADVYRVGPGDQFVVSIGGSQTVTRPTSITPDGYIPLPEVGNVYVGHMTLAEARATALRALRGSFRNVPVEIALAKPRRFYVHISGAVDRPGRVTAGAMTRLSDVLNQAFLPDTTKVRPGERKEIPEIERKPSLRNVVITRGETQIVVDLQRYYAAGEISQNPYLLDGDVINVASYDPLRDAVYVSGAVTRPGPYPFRDGDTVEDLLVLASGKARPTGIGRIHLTRRTASGSLDTLSLSANDNRQYALQPLDHLYIEPGRILAGVATVEGWLRFPGTYPIEPGRTTIGDLVQMAGGLRDGAALRSAYLKRSLLVRERPELASRHADLDFLSRSYLTSEVEALGHATIDLSEVMKPGAHPIYLNSGDSLVVPRDDKGVYVFGQVARTGVVPYMQGQSVDDYITAAGGTTAQAGQTYLIEAGTGRYLTPGKDTIRSGDMIFVDRLTDLADTPELHRLALEERRDRSDKRIRNVQTWLQLAGTAATLVFTYISYRSLRNN